METDPTEPPFSARPKRRRILPGFHLTLGFTIFYLSAIVLIPLAALVLKTVTPTADYPGVLAVAGHALGVATDVRALDSYRLSFGLSFAAALLNGFFGFIAAWALTRYQFPGRRIIDALVDLPFAMPTSVAGLALTQVFSIHGGTIGQVLYEWFGWRIAYTPWGILIALTFIGFPFVVRTLQPVIDDLAIEVEEAAACLGANRWQSFRRVIFPALGPALLTGVMLAFGRGVGEYGSIVFISSMIPYATEITPQLIIIKLDEFDYVGAAGLGLAMLIMSFAIVATVNMAQHFAAKRRGTA
ncbi:MAG TPA: sulfate ABC transporter permease subunit CysT [Candidatus Methylacidiphilales bacterium]|jgi:sulfate transport system permease protein|nr:sulfate ABC transporter permease subunit CysT [Candidatus Methylacidiphilales bacterium]